MPRGQGHFARQGGIDYRPGDAFVQIQKGHGGQNGAKLSGQASIEERNGLAIAAAVSLATAIAERK
jgi:hypothetical protein